MEVKLTAGQPLGSCRWKHQAGTPTVIYPIDLRVVLANNGQRDLLNLPELPIIGGKDCQAVNQTPADGHGFQLGKAIAVKGLYTPCHTQDSICWYLQEGDKRVVFTGDTLFHGGEQAAPPLVLYPPAYELLTWLQDVAVSLRARLPRCTRR